MCFYASVTASSSTASIVINNCLSVTISPSSTSKLVRLPYSMVIVSLDLIVILKPSSLLPTSSTVPPIWETIWLPGGENIDSNIVPLCDECHGKIHNINYNRELQQAGIKRAKEQGKYKGRKKIDYPSNWEEVYSKWKNREITGTKAMEELNLKRNTFYKLVKEYSNK